QGGGKRFPGFGVIADGVVPDTHHTLPVPSHILALGRAIHRYGAVTFGRSFEVRGNPTAHVKGAHERSGATAKGHGIVFGKLPTSRSTQDTAEHGPGRGCD